MKRKLNSKLLIIALIAANLSIVILGLIAGFGEFMPSAGDKLGGWDSCGWTEDSNTKPYWACDYRMGDIFRVTHVEAPEPSSSCSVQVEHFDFGSNMHWLECATDRGGPDWKVVEHFDGLVFWLLLDGMKISH